MGRVRIGVVLLLPEPWRAEVDGLRRALGNPNLLRIAPHITLVPPINLKEGDLQSVFDNVRNVASALQPFAVQVGPVSTFAPKTPVIKLDVLGEHRAIIEQLRELVAVGVLDRELVWPYDPHVTLHDDASDDLIAQSLKVLDSYEIYVPFDSLWVLRQGEGGVWNPLFDARFEPSITVGTGGMAVSLTRSCGLEPRAAEVLDLIKPPTNFALTARIDDVVVGAAIAETTQTFRLLGLRVAEGYRGLGVGSHLARHLRYLALQMGFLEIVDDSACLDVAGLLQQFPARLAP